MCIKVIQARGATRSKSQRCTTNFTFLFCQVLGENHIVFSDVSDEDEVEGPVGRIKGVEESDSDDADNMFRSLS